MKTALQTAGGRFVGPAAGLALLGLLVLVGCNTYSGTTTATSADGAPPASAAQHPILEGVPIPVGFRMVSERSVARQTGRFRMAKVEFVGGTSPEQVTAFYQNYMPSAQFTLKTRNLEAGEYKLRFESPSEECNIRVTRNSGRTVLVVDLGPLPQGSAEREHRPPMPRP
jgi:hypothetical protein